MCLPLDVFTVALKFIRSKGGTANNTEERDALYLGLCTPFSSPISHRIPAFTPAKQARHHHDCAIQIPLHPQTYLANSGVLSDRSVGEMV